MYTLLVLVLLLVLLSETVAATSPTMDPTLPAVPMESFYSDPDGMLNAVCELCGFPLEICNHAFVTNPLQSGPGYIPDPYYNPIDWAQDEHLLAVLEPPQPELEILPPAQLAPDTSLAQPLDNDALKLLDDNATTVQPSTVLSHVEDTYTPGDRVKAHSRGSQRPSTKRQAPRKGGFPCGISSCQKTFDRACDVKRHRKTHLDRSERPHKCAFCPEGFLYPKDLVRHQSKHTQAQGTLSCPFPGCTSEGFSRRDNLLRHQRKQHSSSDSSS